MAGYLTAADQVSFLMILESHQAFKHSVALMMSSLRRLRSGLMGFRPLLTTTASQIKPLLVSSFGGNFVQMPDD